jgi:uncharacterized membrane protein (UPF0127 family)
MRLVAVALLVVAAGCSSDGSSNDTVVTLPPPTPPTVPGPATTAQPSIVPSVPRTTERDTVAPSGSSTAATVPTTEPEPGPTGVLAEGFETVHTVIRRADGSLCELCTYLADNDELRQRGLMFVTDMDGRDGMVFAFQRNVVHEFWMKNTVMPLSAAWFDEDGTFIDSYEMAPCQADPCPTYGPPEPSRTVLEVPQGDLVRFGIGPGSVFLGSEGDCPIAPG